jgi:hypothetical protein
MTEGHSDRGYGRTSGQRYSKAQKATYGARGGESPAVVAHVSGFPRSGTTLLQGLLCTDVAAGPLLGESPFPYQMASAFANEHMRWRDEARCLYESCAAMKDFYRHVIGEFILRLARMHGYPRKLVLKAPMASQHFNALRTLRPTDRFVAVIRDPRDVIASMLAADVRGGRKRTNQEWIAVATHFDRTYMDLRGRLVVVIRYEDIVRDPTCCRKLIDARLGFQILPELLWKKRVFDFLASSTSPHRHFRSTGWGEPITSGRIGVYRHQLSRRLVKIVEDATGRILTHYGY